MLNRVILMGRITHELDLKATPSGISVLQFSIAVDRGYVKPGEERQADFINCVAWRQQAEFISKYFAKGRMIAIEGNLKTRTYDDKNGVKHYVTEVYVDSASFTGEPKQNSGQQPAAAPPLPPEPSQTTSTAVSIGNLEDFEEIISDGEVPF